MTLVTTAENLDGEAAHLQPDSPPPIQFSAKEIAGRLEHQVGVAYDVPFILYIASGPEHEGDFRSACKRHGLEVLLVDTVIGGAQHDLTDNMVIRKVARAAMHPMCRGILASLECKTWSAARWNTIGGVRATPLRDLPTPWAYHRRTARYIRRHSAPIP